MVKVIYVETQSKSNQLGVHFEKSIKRHVSKVRPSGCFCSVDLIHDPMTTVIIAVNTNIALMIEYMTWIIHHKSDILNESCNRQYCRCRTVDVASVHEDMILAYHS